ncbi:trans-aconitate 2-methyltransferase [Methylomonas sp. HYX-M1]|uniref:class I SAM-dependent methyltransferase n=1 Tax=Methylomonas sp. HYX-M1 TaxID=3139307 RepID=UPI00345BC749
MTPLEIGRAYNSITHLWESPAFDRSNGIAQHQKAIAFAHKRGHALDIGCGCSGRLIDLLSNNGFAAEGLDVSDEMIRLAKQKHPCLQFHQQDICEWIFPKRYDFITAWDSIWHIPLTRQVEVLTKIVDGLNKNGVLIFSFGGTTEPGEHKDNAMGPEVYYSSLGTNGFLSLLINLGCACKHLEYEQVPELHAYLIAQKI